MGEQDVVNTTSNSGEGSVAVGILDIPRPPLRGLSQRQRWEHLWIDQLRKLPQYREILNRLVMGQSALGVARWLVEQPGKGHLDKVALATLRKYLNALKIHLEDWMRANGARDEIRKIQEGRKKVLKDLEAQSKKLGLEKKLNPEIEQARKEVVLRYLLQLQLRRCELLFQAEQRAKFPALTGDGIYRLALDMCKEMRNQDTTEIEMKFKMSMVDSSADFAPMSKRELQPGMEEMVDQVKNLTPTDRHILRKITSQVMAAVRIRKPRSPTINVPLSEGGK